MCSSTATSTTPTNTLGNTISVTAMTASSITITFTGPNIDVGGTNVVLTTVSSPSVVIGNYYFLSVSYAADILTLTFSALITTSPTPLHIVYTSSPVNNLLLNKATTLTGLFGYAYINPTIPFNITLGNSYISVATTLNLTGTTLMISTANPAINVIASYNGTVTQATITPTAAQGITITPTSTIIQATIIPATPTLIIGPPANPILNTALPSNILLSGIILNNATSNIGLVTTVGDWYANFVFIGNSTSDSGGTGTTGICPIIYAATTPFPAVNLPTNCAAQFTELRNGTPNVLVDLGCYEYLCLGMNPETNTQLTTVTWAEIWNAGIYPLGGTSKLQVSCPNTFQTIMYSTPNGSTGSTVSEVDNGDGTVTIRIVPGAPVSTRAFSLAGHNNANADMNYVFSHYFNTVTTSLTNPGIADIALYQEPNYQQQQTSIVNACVQVPGICDLPAKTMCANCSRKDLASNPDLLSLCGCQASTTDPLDVRIYGTISPPCDPLCAMAKVSQTVNLTNGVQVECTDAVCVMDNISVSAARSEVGGVSFTQVCPACEALKGADIGCKCIVDVSIPGIINTVGISGSTTFRQYCPNALCLLLNSTTQQLEPIPCSTYVQSANTTVIPKIYPIPMWVWYSVGIIFILGMLVLFSALYAGHNINIVVPGRKTLPRYYVPPGTTSRRY
jgi:hypothetical protein